MGEVQRVATEFSKFKWLVVSLVIACAGCGQMAANEPATKRHVKPGCGSDLVQAIGIVETPRDPRLVPVPDTPLRPQVDVSYACLMKAVAQPTPAKLNEYVSLIEKNPGAWSKDFYELSVSGGTLYAVFWPRHCVKDTKLAEHQWTRSFMDQVSSAGARWRTAAASHMGSVWVGSCPHELSITPGASEDADDLSGKGLSEMAVRKLFRLMILDPKLESLREFVKKHARMAGEYKLGWQMGDQYGYVLTFDTEGTCVPVGFWGGITPEIWNSSYSQIRGDMLARPDDERCISSVTTRWHSKWRK